MDVILIDITILRAMAAAGATVEMILAAVEAAQAVEHKKLSEKRSKDASRKRRSRGVTRSHADIDDVARTHDLPEQVKIAGEQVCEILRAMPPQPDDATELHNAVESALEVRGLKVEREFPVMLDNGRQGRIDLVAEDCVAIELDRRLPRAKSLKKLMAFDGFRIAVTRTNDPDNEFEAMVDAVIAIPPDVTRGHEMSHAVTRTECDKERKVSIPSKERNTSLRDVSTSLRSVDSARPKSTRGSRLPNDWTPSDAEADFGAATLGSAWQAEVPKFRDYWHARAGPGGVKNDWAATWRNWCRKAAEGNSRGGKSHESSKPSVSDVLARLCDETSPDFDGLLPQIGRG